MTGPPATPPSGWYPDPSGSGDQRWWDGHRWTDQTQPPAPSSDWRGWFARSPRADTLGRVIGTSAALCAAGALVVDVAALVRGVPLGGVAVLLVPAIPVLAVGQIWTIALLNARTPRSTGGWRARIRSRQSMSRNPRTFFFGGLTTKLAYPLLGVTLFGWFSAVSSFGSLGDGGPAGSGGGCAYRLNNHGTYTCVSRKAYERAGAVEQRGASGVLLGFFALHTGAALGGIHRRRGATGG